jgi:hypothetical protein
VTLSCYADLHRLGGEKIGSSRKLESGRELVSVKEMTTAVPEEPSVDQRLAMLLAMAMFVLIIDTSLMNASISAANPLRRWRRRSSSCPRLSTTVGQLDVHQSRGAVAECARHLPRGEDRLTQRSAASALGGASAS